MKLKMLFFENEGNGVGREMIVETRTQEELDVKLRRNEKNVLLIYVICLVLWTRKAAHMHFGEDERPKIIWLDWADMKSDLFISKHIQEF